MFLGGENEKSSHFNNADANNGIRSNGASAEY